MRPSPVGGVGGVLCGDGFMAGELVAIWGGVVYSAKEIGEIGEAFPHFRTHPYEVAPGFFMASTSLTAIDDAERFNHCCAPNVGIKGQVVVLARRDIDAGEELTFDYETTDVAPDPFDCSCGAPECRTRIDGDAWKSPEFQQANSGWFNWFIEEMVRGC
ncbi:MAG: SET domain-containing protein-lysine N-methyltransferase [Pirellulaceae bacterium]